MEIKYILLDEYYYDDLKQYISLLPESRQEKIARYRFDDDKMLSLAAGLLIRAYVTKGELNISEHGKPYLKDSDRYFSLSHSGRCVLIALDDKEIGADVEKLPDEKMLRVADRFFHPAERQYIDVSENKKHAFAEIWTRKEAYVKQKGVGLAGELRSFDTTSDALSQRIFSGDIDGYVFSVCIENKHDLNDAYISKLELSDLL